MNKTEWKIKPNGIEMPVSAADVVKTLTRARHRLLRTRADMVYCQGLGERLEIEADIQVIDLIIKSFGGELHDVRILPGEEP